MSWRLLAKSESSNRDEGLEACVGLEGIKVQEAAKEIEKSPSRFAKFRKGARKLPGKVWKWMSSGDKKHHEPTKELVDEINEAVEKECREIKTEQHRKNCEKRVSKQVVAKDTNNIIADWGFGF